MTQLIVEGFGAYGTGIVVSGTGIEPVGSAMLSGVWGQLPLFQNALYPIGVGTLPWDTEDDTLFLYRNMRATSVSEATYPNGATFRRILTGGSEQTLVVSAHFNLDFLPTEHEIIYVFADLLALPLAFVGCDPSGRVWFGVDATYGIYYSATPVFFAQRTVHIELKITYSLSVPTGNIEVRVDGATVISSRTFPQYATGSIGQIWLLPAKPRPVIVRPTFYITDLIVRNTAGSFNKDFMGERSVATLFVSADDPTHQGWTPQYLRRFGNGVLDLTAGGKTALTVPNTTFTNIGAGDFTIEGNVRFGVLPTGSTKAVVFGKWDAGSSNKRSYQLYKGGPALASGAWVFQYSLDGTAGTVTQLLVTTDFLPESNTWYHLAVERAGGYTTFYADGVPIASAADTATYYTGTEVTVIGADVQGTGTIQSNTSFDGWMDEVRFTLGAYRYGSAFIPPAAAFPRGGFDPMWSNVGLIYSFDFGVVSDESSHGLSTTKWNGAIALTPDDGDYAYQTLAKPTPFDATFIEAAFLQATGVYTLSAVPADGNTVTLATTDGSTAAVYTWKTTLASAYQIKIGAAVSDCIVNMAAAINASPVPGVNYGTGTLANFDTTAQQASASSVRATAILAGTAGNALASTATGTAGTWAAATLAGGADIPDYSQFYYERLPSATTVVDSITLSTRAWKSDSGTGKFKASFVGGAGGVLDGANNSLGAVPSVYLDMIETDPDAPSNPLSPTTIARGRVRVTRTS